MKTYELYKESGVIWIGKIPKEWNTIKIKFLDNSDETLFLDGDWIESKVIEEDGIRYLTTGNIGPGYYKEQGSGFISEETFDKLNCTEVYPGDLVASRLNKPIGRACIIPDLGYRVVVAVDNVIIRPREDFDRKYLMYVMNDSGYSNYTDLISRGATMQRISRGQLGRITIPAPRMEEQTQIANYLDHKTAIIDAIIEKKELLLQKLKTQRQAIINEAVTKGLNSNAKMKYSGIEWLGEIPEHWEFNKAKRNTYMKGRIGWQGLKQEEFIDEGPYLITGMNFKDGVIRWDEVYHITKERYDEAPEIQLKEGDVLMTKDGTIGKLLFVDNLPGPASLNSHLLVLRCTDESYLPKYLYYQLMSELFLVHVELYKTGTTFYGITQESVGKYQMLLPPINEQIKIVEYLENNLDRISMLDGKTKKQIKKLKSYRQSIISEAVTGKIDVRDWQPKTLINV